MTSTSQEPLFDGYALPVADATDGLSADRKRTLRQRQQVEAGIHPLTGLRSRPDLGTCGDCVWRQNLGYHDRSYPKCTVDEARLTHGASTDVRAWWPACSQHMPAGPKPLLSSPDAARWTP